MKGFVVERYADFGSGEPWVARLMLGLQELVFVVPAFAGSRDEFMNELGEVFEALGMAFEELRALRKQVAEGAAVIVVTKTYETLYGHLWRTFRDRFPAVMNAIGLDIGFTYKNDAQFEKGASQLLARRPELNDLVDLMRRDRADFQNRLADYRNAYLEHRKRKVDPKLLEDFHHPGSAENAFENVWQAMEDYVVLYVIANLPTGFHVVEIPNEERDSTRPTRYRLAVEGL